MNKNLKNIIIAGIISGVFATGYDVLSKVNSKINELNETIEKLENEKKEKELEIKNKDKNIEELNAKISELSEELEDARRNIERYTRVTHYNRHDVSEPSYATNIHMRRALAGTPLENSAESFIEAEEIYGVNAYFLAAICAQESSWGKSERAINNNNLTGYAVYNSNAKGATFDSWHDSILSTAKLIKYEYLTEGGHSFNGYGSRDINERYCFYEDGKTVDYNWSANIDWIAYNLLEKANRF